MVAITDILRGHRIGIARDPLGNTPAFLSSAFAAICYDGPMQKRSLLLGLASFLICAAPWASAQAPTGTLEIAARITPTSARPEPVRQFTFYVLTKSYTEIVKEIERKDAPPPRDKFIDGLKVSPELRTWLKNHEVLDLSSPDLDKLLSPDDVIHTPEFLVAFQRANGGGVTTGMPRPKYTDADKTQHPEKYEKLRLEYLAALRKFIQVHPESVSGIELELDEVNPQRKWDTLQSEHRKRVQRLAPDVAQLKYLAGKADTDLDGRATIPGLPPGNYWITSLNLDAAAGDTRLRWDVPLTIQPGQTFRIELTNLNSTDARGYNP